MFKTTLLRILIGFAIVTIAGCGPAATTQAPATAPAATQAPAATATTQASADKVSFTYMSYVGRDKDQVGATIDAYMKLNPNVTIDYQIVDQTALQQKLTTMIQSNT